MVAQDCPATVAYWILGMAQSSYYRQTAEAPKEGQAQALDQGNYSRMPDVRWWTPYRTVEAQRLDPEPQACAAAHALDRHSERKRAQEESHNREPARFPSLPDSRLADEDCAAGPGADLRHD